MTAAISSKSCSDIQYSALESEFHPPYDVALDPYTNHSPRPTPHKVIRERKRTTQKKINKK